MNDTLTRIALHAADGPAVHDRLETPAGMWRDVKRLLVIRAGNLGDMLLATPALRAIKQSMRGVHLTVLTGADGADVVRLNDDIDDIIVCSVPWLDAEATFARTALREEAMIEVIGAGRFDAAIVLPTGGRDPMPAAYLCYVAGVPRIQPPWPCAGWTGTSQAACPDASTSPSLDTVTASTHEVERCLDVVGRIGMHTDEARLVLNVPHADRQHAAEIVSEIRTRFGSGPLVVMAPGAATLTGKCATDLCADVADLLVERLRAVVILVGDDTSASSTVVARMRERAVDLTSTLPLSTTCALLKAADATVTANPDVVHLSAAMGTPVVTVFAVGTSTQGWRPWGVPHRHLPGTSPKGVVTAVQALISVR